jgi:pimeloyl-ACP methyl ester carboxylesterase
MHIEKNILLERVNKKTILIDTFYNTNKTDQPVVIFCHGYKGFKDWGAWDLMAKQIAEAGYCFIKFNFSHNGGTVDNPIDFPDLEAFGQNNYTKELDDLKDVMDWVQVYFRKNASIDTNRIHLIGHSRGGGIAILKASEDDRVKKLVTLASVSDFGNRFGTENEIQEWKENGVKYVQNGRTKQQMPHYYQFYEDFKTNEVRLHIQSAAKQLDIPTLIIHGDKDTSVRIQEAYNIHKWSKTSQIEIIEDADHVFNTKHPWQSNSLSENLDKIVRLIIKFLAE